MKATCNDSQIRQSLFCAEEARLLLYLITFRKILRRQYVAAAMLSWILRLSVTLMFYF